MDHRHRHVRLTAGKYGKAENPRQQGTPDSGITQAVFRQDSQPVDDAAESGGGKQERQNINTRSGDITNRRNRLHGK